MNKALMAARAAFRGQTAKVNGKQYDNSPFPEGIYTMKVTDSKIVESPEGAPKHKMTLEVVSGDMAGRKAWPYSPDISAMDGVISMVKNVRAILGDVVPGDTTNDGQFEVKADEFVGNAEEYASRLIGEVVEAKCMNQKVRADGSHLKDDGTPWQNWYINRGLGEDGKAAAAPKGEPRKNTVRKPDASMSVGKRKPIKR